MPPSLLAAVAPPALAESGSGDRLRLRLVLRLLLRLLLRLRDPERLDADEPPEDPLAELLNVLPV